MKTLIIVRGLPGAGKSSLAEVFDVPPEHLCEADQYFMSEYGYEFRPHELRLAHLSCEQKASDLMEQGVSPIMVANTFTRSWEFAPYEQLANHHGYRVVHLVVENRHGSESVHNVPEDTVQKMRSRFEISL